MSLVFPAARPDSERKIKLKTIIALNTVDSYAAYLQHVLGALVSNDIEAFVF
jgi:hypothetical protein